MGLPVEALANAAIKICLIKFKTSISRKPLAKWIDAHYIKMYVNSCAQSQMDNLLVMQGNILHMNVILWLYWVNMVSHILHEYDIHMLLVMHVNVSLQLRFTGELANGTQIFLQRAVLLAGPWLSLPAS